MVAISDEHFLFWKNNKTNLCLIIFCKTER